MYHRTELKHRFMSGFTEKVQGTDEDNVTRQKTALLKKKQKKQKQPRLFVQSASGNDGRVSRTRTGREPSTVPGPLPFPTPFWVFFVRETIEDVQRNSSKHIEGERATVMGGGVEGGVIQAAHVSGFRINFSKQFTPMMMTAQTRRKACRVWGGGNRLCRYLPAKGDGGGGNRGGEGFSVH